MIGIFSIILTVKTFKVPPVSFGLGGKLREKNVYHVVSLKQFNFEIIEHFLKIVELIDGIRRIEIPILHFVLSIIFLKRLIMHLVLKKILPPLSISNLPDDKIRRYTL